MGGSRRAEEPKRIGDRYVLKKLLGRGGVGEVWAARHETLKTEVAIKLLQGAPANHETTRKRFLTEAQVTAKLKTRHAVQVFDFGVTDDGQPYLVMERLDGETIARRLSRQNRLPITTTVLFLSQISRALDKAHGLGIVHRDLKPHNVVIVVDEDGAECVKVLDFGIAKLLHDLGAEGTETWKEGADTASRLTHLDLFGSFTRTESILGTPRYMAPEQVDNLPTLDLRADIWAFGVLAFECLTGVAPFEGKTIVDLFLKIRRGEHPPAKSFVPDLPAAFEVWFDKACAVNPSRRFPSAKIAAISLAESLGVPLYASGPFSTPALSSPSSRPSITTDAPQEATLDEAPAREVVNASSVRVRPRARKTWGLLVVVALFCAMFVFVQSGFSPLSNSFGRNAGSAEVTGGPGLGASAAPLGPSLPVDPAMAPLPSPVAFASSSLSSLAVEPVASPSAAPSASARARPVAVGVAIPKTAMTALVPSAPAPNAPPIASPPRAPSLGHIDPQNPFEKK